MLQESSYHLAEVSVKRTY